MYCESLMTESKSKRVYPKKLQVYVSDELHQVMTDLSEATGASISSLLSGFLEPNKDYFIQLTRAAKAAQERNVSMFDALQQVLFKAIGDSAQLGLEMGEQKKQKLRKPSGSARKKKTTA